MNVLSLFDGLSCGRIALDRCGIPVTKYYASEIDKHAIKVSSTKCPETIHLGSVVDVKASQLDKVDILIAGSPCQGFSNAGKGLNFDDPRSALFFEFVRILEECKAINPNVIFMLENVRMKKEWEDVISRILGIQPILVNSALLSAQNRERLYWTNIAMKQHGLFGDNYCSIPQPKDKGIYLKDILQSEVDEKYYLSEKSIASILNWNAQTNPLEGIASDFRKVGCLTARGNDDLHSGIKLHTEYIKIGKNGERKENQEKASCFTAGGNSGGNHSDMDYQIVHDPVCVAMRGRNPENSNDRTPGAPTEQRLEPKEDGKTICLTSVAKDNLVMENVVVHNMMPRSSKTGKGGTGPLSRADGKTYYLDTGSTNAVEVKENYLQWDNSGKGHKSQQDRAFYEDGKMGTVCTHPNKNNVFLSEKIRIRRLTPIECARLQNVSDDYFFHNGQPIVSESQMYRMLGNGFTVDVISYIFSFMSSR